MAHITLTGTLLTPAGKTAYRDQIRFTHKSTTGETVRSSVDLLTIIASGFYHVELEYGLVLIEYKSANDSQFKNLGVATVNGTNPSTSIPELLNGLVPVSSAELIQFQAILADAVAAKNESVIARNEAEAFANSIDLINDLSQSYTFKTVAQMKADTTILPVDKKVFWQGYNSVSDGGSNWGIVKSGPHTDDGGEFFTLNDGKHVQANLKGEKVNCRKFNVFPNVDGTTGMLSAITAAKRLGSIVYVPAAMTIGDFYEVNAQMDLTACGIVGDGRDSSRIKTNSGALPAILQRGDGALTLYTVMKGVYIRNNGGTGDGVSWDLAPRHNYMTDVKIYGYKQGAAVRIKDSTWITDMDDVFLDNCKWGLYFDRTQSIGNVGGSHTFRGGAIEGCERAFEGDSKNLAFYGTTIEGNQGIQETFANNTRVGGVCKLGVGEGPVSFQDCWMEGNGLPAIITGVGSTSEASATAQVTVNGGRHQAEKLIWIMGNTSQISIRDINFDYTPISRNALIWVNSREARVLIENIRYRNDYQRVYDPYNYNYLPRTVMLHEGGSVLFPQNINGEVFAGSQASLKKSRLDNVSFEIVLDDFVQGSGITRTF